MCKAALHVNISAVAASHSYNIFTVENTNLATPLKLAPRRGATDRATIFIFSEFGRVGKTRCTFESTPVNLAVRTGL